MLPQRANPPVAGHLHRWLAFFCAMMYQRSEYLIIIAQVTPWHC